ncbi:MAG: DegT/DnrJ/EryC1/StrS family aminotransferase [bacterium]
MKQSTRIYLSPPHMSGREQARLAEAFASNYIAPVGPQVDAFEQAFAATCGLPHALALSSGTAAMHLAFRVLGVGPGDTVFCSTLTFIASIAPALQLGATPVFIDAAAASWCLDPALLAQALDQAAAQGRLPKAVVAVDLYGQSCDMDQILAACRPHGIPVIEDAAEALGATYKGAPAGQRGDLAVYSFNGNKIITTSAGGMLASRDGGRIEKCRYWSSQAREPAPHYEHAELGYNYRMSNLLAAVGCAQLDVLEERVAAKRAIFDCYVAQLGSLPGVAFMPEAPYGRCSRWLTVLQLDPSCGTTPEAVRLALEQENIEARPVWKPMHLQPVFAKCPVWTAGGQRTEDRGQRSEDRGQTAEIRGQRSDGRGQRSEDRGQTAEDRGQTAEVRGQETGLRTPGSGLRTPGSGFRTPDAGLRTPGSVAEMLFRHGLCLPSGTAMTTADVDRVCGVVKRVVGAVT